MAPEARERSFDELARRLTSGDMSRGRVLRLMGAALVGGALGSLGIGEASADPPGCKRNGKACKKDTQCCSGNCSGGTCAAACTSDGGACTTNGECCSDNCSDGFCCPSGSVGLSNGTCAVPCTADEQCLAAGCDPTATQCEPEFGGGGAAYCRNSGALAECGSTADCPTGQFCVARGLAPSACATAC